MVERAIAIRIRMGHHISTSNPAVLLKNLLAQHEDRLLYAFPIPPISSSACFLVVFWQSFFFELLDPQS
jgi:hypothetical protein